MAQDFELWKGKDLSGLFKNIYDNQRETQSKISVLIDSLRPLIKTAGDAAIIVPLIAEYLDVSVKNDSHLVRLSAVVQRIIAAEKIGGTGAAGILSEEEKAQLLGVVKKEAEQIEAEQKDAQKRVASGPEEVKQIIAQNITPRDDEEDPEESEDN